MSHQSFVPDDRLAWRRHRRAITLMDTIMSVLVLAVAMPPVLTLMYEGTRETALPEARVVATNLIRDKIEELVTQRHEQGYAAVTTGTTTESSITGHPSFSRTTQITEDGTKKWKTATVTVTWTGAGEQSVSLKAAVIFARF